MAEDLYHRQLKDFIRVLVDELNLLNGHDMLDGYLDCLAESFNEELEALKIPVKFKTYGEDE